MEKQTRRFEIKFDFDWECGVEISKIREDLDAIEKLGATHLEIDGGSSYDVPYVRIDGYVHRMETGEEYLERIAKKNARENSIKQSELRQLKRLKEKYKD